MTDKNKGSHDQDYASAADPASTGQKTQKVSLWQWPLIPADDPIYKAGFGTGEKRSTPVSRRVQPRKFTLVIVNVWGYNIQKFCWAQQQRIWARVNPDG